MAQSTITNQLGVEGMTCDNCVRHVTKALESVPGVASASVDLVAACATVEFDPAEATTAAIASAVKEAGYTLKTPV